MFEETSEEGSFEDRIVRAEERVRADPDAEFLTSMD
jgi:hypothetical protein